MTTIERLQEIIAFNTSDKELNETLQEVILDIGELVCILNESDLYEMQDTPFKVRVQAVLVKQGVDL